MTASPRSSRATVPFFVLLAAPVLILLDAGIAALGGWGPGDPIEEGVIAASAVALVLVVALASVRPVRSWVGARWRQVTATSVSTVLALVTFDLVLSLRPPSGPPHPHLQRPSRTFVLTPDPRYVPGISGPGDYTSNAAGIRAPEPAPDAVRRVLCVGGSTTQCLFLDDEETWPALVGAALSAKLGPVWVGNAGRSGFTTVEHLDLLEGTSVLDGVDILVLMVGLNDMQRYGLMGLPPVGATARPAVRPLWSRSGLLDIAQAVRHSRMGPEQDPTGVWMVKPRRKRAEGIKLDVLPDLTAALAAYRDRLRKLAELGEARGVQLVFVTQATLYSADMPPEAEALLWGGSSREKGHYFTGRAMRDAMHAFNQVTIQVAAEGGHGLVDLSSMNGRLEWFYDDCHFNEAGCAEVARLVAPALMAVKAP